MKSGEASHERLFILNDPPYGTEGCYNALRLSHVLLKQNAETEVTVFLLGDAVVGGRRGQKTPDGYYNVERMLKRVLVGRGRILICGTCMDARGMNDDEIVEGAARSTMDETGRGDSISRQGAGFLTFN